MLGRSAPYADFAAVLGLGSRRTTRYVRCAHCARTTAASQSTKRAARADPSPVLLAAPQIAPAGHRLPRSPTAVVCVCNPPSNLQRRDRVGGSAPAGRRGGEPRHKRSKGPFVPGERPGLLARRGLQGQGLWPARASAPRQLTCRTLSERRERDAARRVVRRATRPAPQGSRCAAPTAPPKRCRLPGCGFAAPLSASGPSQSVIGPRPDDSHASSPPGWSSIYAALAAASTSAPPIRRPSASTVPCSMRNSPLTRPSHITSTRSASASTSSSSTKPAAPRRHHRAARAGDRG